MRNFIPWLNKWFHRFNHKDVDILVVKQKMQEASASTDDLLSYVDDLEERIDFMVQKLKDLYKRNSITFYGFKSFALACEYLRNSITDDTESAYNNLIKLEPLITSEQHRHLSLIKLAVLPSGKRVIEEIYRNPTDKASFEAVFQDGMYQQLWLEIHKLSEYILIQKNKVYH